MKTYLFNPYTGKPRHPPDIASDPAGLLIAEPGEPLVAASPPPQSAQLIEPDPDFAKDPISDHAQAALYNFTQGTPHHAAVRTLYSLAHQFVNLPTAGSGLMEGKDAVREALKAVRHWASTKCPCGPPNYANDEPKVCPLCRADTANTQDYCKAVESTIPQHLLSMMDAALSQGQQTEQGSRK